MTQGRSEAELVTLRKLAQQHASARKERVTSVHLLAAIASREGPAAGLLHERRLDPEALLKASRSFDDEGPDPISRAMAAARELATRSPLPEPSGIHLLLGLLGDRRSAAHRSLVSSGIDVARLRTATMQLALGVVTARRTAPVAQRARPEREPVLQAPHPAARRHVPAPGVTVPLFPPPAARAPDKPVEKAEPAPEPAQRVHTPEPAQRVHTPEPAQRVHTMPAARPHAPTARRGQPKRAASTPRFTLDRAKFPTLASLGKNLTLAAHEGSLEAVVGRDAEIDGALDILGKRRASSPCLVGPAGVGKTAVAHGIAARFAAAEADAEGGDRVLVEILVSELVTGTGARGALAERMAAIRSEVREAAGRVVLFVDDLVELFSGGPLEEAASELKVGLARGELSIVGTATPEEYRRAIEADPALARRFTVVDIDEPNEEDAFLLLKSVALGLGRHHGLAYGDEGLAAAVSWSVRYLPGRALPDKAIAILDLAGARAKRAQGASKAGRSDAPPVGPAEVASVVAELADVPIERLLETDRDRMLRMEELLGERVVGHKAPLARIATILRRNAAGLRGRRPIGTLLLLGPTGVGKTETAKAVAEVLFHSPDAMTRLDMSEYAEAHAIARLVGAPPGYVGYEAGGQLTEAVRRRPYQVVLLDEIEKAHRDVLEAFLQVFDEGRLTDGRGRRVDFTNTVIVLTSNLGAAEAGAARTDRAVGFARATRPEAQEARASSAMLTAARASLPPELYNRLDEVLCFETLARTDVAEIARRQLEGLAETLAFRGVTLEIGDGAIEALLVHGGYDPELGARPMKRAIARLVEAPLAEMILRGELEQGWVAMVGAEEGQIVVDALDPRRKTRRSAAG